MSATAAPSHAAVSSSTGTGLAICNAAPARQAYCRSRSLARTRLQEYFKGMYGPRADDCAVLPSGMAAIGALLYSIAVRRPTSTFVLGSELYCDTGRTARYLKEAFPRLRVDFVDVRDGAAVASLFRARGRHVSLLFLESCSNPSGQMFDWATLPALRRLAGDDLVVAVDNTWLTACIFNPLQHCADVVVESLSKYHSAGQCIGGMAVGRAAVVGPVQHWARVNGQFVGADHCRLFLAAGASLQQRLAAASAVTVRVARHLEARWGGGFGGFSGSGVIVRGGNAAGRGTEGGGDGDGDGDGCAATVVRVLHPALASHPTAGLFRKYCLSGGGGGGGGGGSGDGGGGSGGRKRQGGGSGTATVAAAASATDTDVPGRGGGLVPPVLWLHVACGASMSKTQLSKRLAGGSLALETSFGANHCKVDPWPSMGGSERYEWPQPAGGSGDSKDSGRAGAWLRVAVGYDTDGGEDEAVRSTSAALDALVKSLSSYSRAAGGASFFARSSGQHGSAKGGKQKKKEHRVSKGRVQGAWSSGGDGGGGGTGGKKGNGRNSKDGHRR